jgi:hypothetical protein
MPTTEVTLDEPAAQLHVLLSDDGDHLVVKFETRPNGDPAEHILPRGSFTWERTVGRAERGAAFL